MGDLLRPKFGEKKEQPKKYAPAMKPSTGSMEDLIPNLLKTLVEKSGLEIDPNLKILAKNIEIRDYINSLGGGPLSNETIATHRKQWRTHSKEELLSIAENSTKTDWSKNAASYWALTEELESKRRDG